MDVLLSHFDHSTEYHSICYDDDSKEGLGITSSGMKSNILVVWRQIVNAVWLYPKWLFSTFYAFSRLLASAVECAKQMIGRI